MADQTSSSLDDSFVIVDFNELSEVEGTTGLKITAVSLNGVNYLSWSKAIHVALSKSGRLGFIDESFMAPPSSDPTYDEWSMNDHLVTSWILNSIEGSLRDLFSFAESAKDLWDAIKEVYSQQENLYRVFELKKSIAEMPKGEKSFAEYLSKLKMMWDELAIQRPATTDALILKKRDNEDKIFNILMGLGSEFESLQEKILIAADLPPLNMVCARIQKEETRKSLMCSIQKNDSTSNSSALFSQEGSTQAVKRFMNTQGGSSSKDQGGKCGRTSIVCDHCEKMGHSKEKCWILHPHLKQRHKDSNNSDRPNTNAFVAIPDATAIAAPSIEKIPQRALQHLKIDGEANSVDARNSKISSEGADEHMSNKPMIVELAVAAMEELTRMAQAREPLWVTGENGIEVLNEEEYLKTFLRGIAPKPLELSSEASRESAIVIMNHVSLVEILMDVNQWSTVFCGIVSRAITLEVLSAGGAGNYNGALQVMTSEFQIPTPLVPTRENYFVRYCKQHAEGTWAVVDVSLDSLHPGPVSRSRRRPSGCLIQELQNGYSKVIWVEHILADDRAVHNIYRPLVNSGIAFGAKRWVATLDRQCERLASSLSVNIPAGDQCVITTPDGRKCMLKLAERMVISFCSGVGASTAHAWTTLSATGSDDVRVMTRKSMDDPGRPTGIVLTAATSFWIPVPMKRVLDFLRDVNHLSEWDILSNGGQVQEMAHIANGRDPGNSVSLLRVNSANSSQNNMLILQESRTDPTGSYLIYAPVDIAAMNIVLSGGDPDYVALLPSGFAILPDGPRFESGGILDVGTWGSLLTVAFQILVDSVPTAKLALGSVATANSLIKCTVERIQASVMCEGTRKSTRN